MKVHRPSGGCALARARCSLTLSKKSEKQQEPAFDRRRLTLAGGFIRGGVNRGVASTIIWPEEHNHHEEDVRPCIRLPAATPCCRSPRSSRSPSAFPPRPAPRSSP